MAEPIIILRPEELEQLIARAVAAGIRDAGAQGGAEWLPVTDCGLPEKTVRRGVKDGAIEGRRIGRALFVRRASLESWAAERPSAERKPVVADTADPVQRAIEAGRLRVVPAAAAKAGR